LQIENGCPFYWFYCVLLQIENGCPFYFINVGDRQIFKDIYQMTPDELRKETEHSRKVSWSYRLDRIRKSKLFFLILLVGIVGLVVAGIFVKDLYIEYSGGAKPTVKLIVHFVLSALVSIQDKNNFS
jgi:hypothetical protein